MGTEKPERSLSERAASEVVMKEKLSETVANCLMVRKNEELAELLMKLGRMAERKASDISSGLSEKEVS